MAGVPGCAPRRYTHEEKAALATEISRRVREQGGSAYPIAKELGTTGTSYLSWIKAGIVPVTEPENRRRPAAPARRT